MRRLLKTLTCVASGVALSLAVGWSPDARGQGQGREDQGGSARQKQDRDRRSDQGGEEGNGSSSESLDRALKSFQEYREETAKGIEQSRKEIDRLARELTDLIQMRIRMAVALASYHAEAQVASPGFPGGPGGFPGGTVVVGQPQGQAGSPGQGGNRGDDKEAGILKREAVGRELEQIQNQLRAEIAQARGQAEQLAAQIRNVREQRRGQEKMESERRSDRQEREKSQKD